MNSQVTNIALFPLQTFLLPGEEIPLKIFEPRYIQLINDCEKSGMSFGVPFIQNNTITSYGSEVELLSIVAKNSLDEMVVLVKCVRNFHLLDYDEELPNKLYGGGVIEYVDDFFETNNPELIVLTKKLNLELNSFLGSIPYQSSYNLFDIAKSLHLRSEDKFKLYSLRNQNKMEGFLLKHLKYFEILKKNEEALQKNFMLN